jgi:hypothetical protein
VHTITGMAGAAALLISVGIINSPRGHIPVPVPEPTEPVQTTLMPPADDLGCMPATPILPDGIASLTVGGDHETVSSWHCVDAKGRHPSLVRISKGLPGSPGAAVTTLVSPQYGLSVRTFQVDANVVQVTGVFAAGQRAGRWDWSGVAVRLDFATGDGKNFTLASAQEFAEPCVAGLLSVAVSAPTWWTSDQTAMVRFVNSGSRSCVMTGYPQVRALNDAASHPARETMHGPFGGVVSDDAPPIVILQPREAATALLESATSSGACGRSDRLGVSAPGQAEVIVRYAIDLCGLQIHPLSEQYFGPTS